ncbi:hypothetical protein F4777DRAFT_384716 [Nemania sp. FL0916]|nr:hypothetical protein F4777DRAFT_384716 [Nemania sp. FL0916]
MRTEHRAQVGELWNFLMAPSVYKGRRCRASTMIPWSIVRPIAYSFKYFTSRSTLWHSWPLLGNAMASPSKLLKRDEQIIGYRRCSKEQAEDYNKNGLNYKRNYNDIQIGSGIYTAYDRDVWDASDNVYNWYCVISANKDAMKRVNKVWIPKDDPLEKDVELWFAGDEWIDDYIKSLDDSWDPKKTIRLSIIDHYKDTDVQLLITPDLVKDTSFAWKVECKEHKEDVENKPVNYNDWPDNVKGSKK